MICRECLCESDGFHEKCPHCGSKSFKNQTENGQHVELMPDGFSFRVGLKCNGEFNGKVLFKNKFGQSYFENWSNGIFIDKELCPTTPSELQPYQNDYITLAQTGMLRANQADYLSVLLGIASPEEYVQWCQTELNLESFAQESYTHEVLRDFLKSDDEVNTHRFMSAFGDAVNKELIDKSVNIGKFLLTKANLNPSKNQCAFLPLFSPVINPLYYGTDYSAIEILLGMTFEQVDRIIHFTDYVVFLDGKPVRSIGSNDLNKIPVETYVVLSGPEAIRELLKQVNVDSELNKIKQLFKDEMNSYSSVTSSDTNYLSLFIKARLLYYFKVHGISPDWLVLDVVPIPPVIDKTNGLPVELLYLYGKLYISNKRQCRLSELNAPTVIVNNEKRILQHIYDCVISNGCFDNSYSFDDETVLRSLTDMIRGQRLERILYKEGAIYWGTTKNGCRDGEGILVYPGRYLYIGHFKSNKMDGHGKLYSGDGNYSEGEFSDGSLGIGSLEKSETLANFISCF